MICIILKLQKCAFTETDGHLKQINPKQIGHGPKIGFILYKKNISHFTMIFFLVWNIALWDSPTHINTTGLEYDLEKL